MDKINVSNIVKIDKYPLGKVFVIITDRYFVEDSIGDNAGHISYRGDVLNRSELDLVEFNESDIIKTFYRSDE